MRAVNVETIGKPRASGKPAPATARKISILLELVRYRRISLAKLRRDFDVSERTLLRDLQELRAIGQRAGFGITEQSADGIVHLAEFAARPAGLVAGERRFRSLIAELFKAFGEPLRSLREGLPASAEPREQAGFLRVVMPQLIAGSKVAQRYDELERAFENRARVRFIYHAVEREVEPAAAIVRSGRYYLIARQLRAGKGEWRVFALDEIGGPIRRCGSFEPKEPPAEYLSADSVGWIKTGRKDGVEVRISARFAAGAASRRWQAAQRVTHHADGSATLRFEVGDVDEAIRWALGFGAEARIVGPPAAVARAREILAQIAEGYTSPGTDFRRTGRP